MPAKLLPQVFFQRPRAGENHQATGVAVQAMHGPQPPQVARPRRPSPWRSTAAAVRRGSTEVAAARRQLGSSACRVEVMPAGFSTTTRCWSKCRMRTSASCGGGRSEWAQQLDHVHQAQPVAGIDAEIAADHHPPRLQQPTDLGPRFSRQPLAQRRGDGLVHLSRQDAEISPSGSCLGSGHFELLPREQRALFQRSPPELLVGTGSVPIIAPPATVKNRLARSKGAEDLDVLPPWPVINDEEAEKRPLPPPRSPPCNFSVFN